MPMNKKAAADAAFIDISALDRAVAERGSFTVLDWLLAEGTLAYDDYAAWRDGRLAGLDEALTLAPPDLDRLLTEVDRHGQALHLAAEAREVFSWSASNAEALKASKRADVHRRLVQQWRRAKPTPQFDLFMDNAAASTERRLCEALSRCRLDEAARELDSLSRLDSSNKALGDYQNLITYGRHLQTPPPTNATELRAELDGLEQEVQPLARTLLAAGARDYLTLAWRRLALGLSELPAQQPADEHLHSSHAYAQIHDWAAVRRSLETEPRLLTQPRWLQQLARACRATGKPEQGLLWWLVCIDRDPHSVASLQESRDDPALLRLWREYQALEGSLRVELPESGFPGFVLLRRPGLVHGLGSVAPLQQPETLAILRLLEARQAAEDEIPLRKALAAIDPVLLKMVLAVSSR